MRSVVINILLIAQPALADLSPKSEARFGLAFGSSTIVASRYNSTGALELISYPAGPEYQAYYQDVARGLKSSNKEMPHVDAQSLFARSIQPITHDLRRQFQHDPEYSAIFMPSIFDYKSHQAALFAMFTDVEYAYRTGSARTAACYGFGFLDGKNLGRPIEECNEDGPQNLILLLEYEKEYLFAWLLDVAFELGTYPVHYEGLFLDHGETQRELLQDAVYWSRIQDSLDAFIVEGLQRYKCSEIRAIVTIGGASETAFEDLRKVAVKAVDTDIA